MKCNSLTLKRLLAMGGAVFTMIAAPLAANYAGLDAVGSVMAAEDGAKKGQGGAGGGKGGTKKGASQGGKGRSIEDRVFRAEPDEDSDRPEWAGVKGGKAGGGGRPPGAGTKKGDLFGDMVVLLRDENGEPILVNDQLQVIAFIYDENGNVVPLTDSAGNLVIIPYDEEGELLGQVVVDGTTYSVVPAEVDLGRLSVGRSPSKVLDHALDEALAKLTAEFAVISLDAAGRLTVDGVTIDSPLENLALYDVYMTTGSIPGVTLPAGFNPASLFAAAADKTSTVIVDTVVYMNSILGINSETSYYDFSTYNYDRYTTWKDAKAVVLVLQPDGTYAEQEISLYDVVFDSTNWTDTTAGGADDFAQAADDYLQVLEFVHDNAVR